jgi:GAF domain-containing protein
VTASARFRFEYAPALLEHVARGDETTLRHGYELGRTAVAEGISALDLAGIHHEALESALRTIGFGRASEVIAAAAAFFQEILSAFEMVHRGYREAAAAATVERRHAAMLRQLSSFLADASLSAQHTDATSEVLHLVAEHARELTGASYAIASWSAGGGDVRATSCDPEAITPPDSTLLGHLERLGHALPSRVSRAQWPQEPTLRAVGTVSNVLSVPIIVLDGRRAGLLQLVDKRAGDFRESDEAVAVHLADMTAAALERAELYRRHRVSL